ncbi:protein kinase domain-containing protein, partial [Quadrisphaera oryzae]
MTGAPRVLGDRYEVSELLGRGGMAEVHAGRDQRLGRRVAIKLLRSDMARDPVFQARFRREAQSTAGLNHPAIVAVYDTGEDVWTESGGAQVRTPYIVMEYVEGRTVRELLDEAGGAGLGTQRAVEITAGVLTALQAA